MCKSFVFVSVTQALSLFGTIIIRHVAIEYLLFRQLFILKVKVCQNTRSKRGKKERNGLTPSLHDKWEQATL